MREKEIKAILQQINSMKIPDKDQILAACEEIPVLENNSVKMPSHFRFRLKPALAVCLTAAFILSCVSAFAVIAEAREYNEAVTFFKQYDLSTAGLTRSEIKNVYRDISTGKFSYDKTVSVITQNVGGYEIFQNDPAPEEVEGLWNYVNNSRNLSQVLNRDKKKGISYRYDNTYRMDESLGFEVTDKAIFEKYQDDKKLWSISFENLCIDGYADLDNITVVYGYTPVWSSEQTSYAWMAMVNNTGELVWKTILENGFGDEYIASVIKEEDRLVVFSRGDLRYLCMAKYDLNGNRISFNKNEIGNYGIKNAAKLGSGYILQLWNGNSGEQIIKVQNDGTIADTFTYSSEDESYCITDMIEYNGRIYLSAYAVPKLADERYEYHNEIAPILNTIFENNEVDISSEKLTNLVRDNYTAILFMCDPGSGEPQKYYSVKGSVGGAFALNENGLLLWDVESITDTYLSLYTSSFSIGGASCVYRYSFDAEGKLVSQEKTGEIMDFRR